MENRLFQLERKEKEPYDVLHVHLRIPKRPRLLPEPTRGHLRAAVRETLLAGRSVLDAVVEKVEPQSPGDTAKTQAG